MKTLMMTVVLVSVLATSGCKPKVKTKVKVSNLNSIELENSDILVWLLTAEQADPPPATKAEAVALGPVNVAAQTTERFRHVRKGNYVLIAANANYIAGLADTDSITAGTDYSTLEFVVRKRRKICLTVVNGTDVSPFLPVIVNLNDPAGGEPEPEPEPDPDPI